MADVEEVKQESLFEYHLYTLQRPTTLAENQTKQVALMSATNIPVRKEFLLMGANYYYSGQYSDIGQKLKVSVFVEFQNKGNGLGIPLPRGIVRVYTNDAQGNVQFVGEDQIDHTPRNESIRLNNVTADRKQTDFRKLAGEGRYNSIFETAYQIVLRNAREEAALVIVGSPCRATGRWCRNRSLIPR